MKNQTRENKLFQSMILLTIGAQLFIPLGFVHADVASAISSGGISAAWPAVRAILNNLGINTGAIQTQSQYGNVSEYKQNASVPSVALSFAPEKPRVGEKIKAVAAASAFASDSSKLYYTWFLRRKNCQLEGSDRNEYAVRSQSFRRNRDYPSYEEMLRDDPDDAVCDEDRDGMITVNDWKVAASKYIVQNNFTPDLGGKYNGDLETFYAINSGWNEEDDNDGYQAWQGGADGERMNSHCHAHNATSGVIYELSRDNTLSNDSMRENLLCGRTEAGDPDAQYHLFPWAYPLKRSGSIDNYYELTRRYVSSSQYYYRTDRDEDWGNDNDLDAMVGNDDFGENDDGEKREERFWETDPRNPSTAGNLQSDESNLAGLGINEFTWEYEEGDEVGVAVEGISTLPTRFEDSSRMIFWAFSIGNEQQPCQPENRGRYPTSSSETGGGTQPPDIPVGFIDFDYCIENSTQAPVSGGSLSGGQPGGLEVELLATPQNPANDSSGENRGGPINILASVIGSSLGENNLEYNWKIQQINIESDRLSQSNLRSSGGYTVNPIEKDWQDSECDDNGSDGSVAPYVCGEGACDDYYDCPFTGITGQPFKTRGLGVNQLNFYSSIEDDSRDYDSLFNSNGDGFIRVTVTARESQSETDATTALSGTASIVIKITSSEANQIQVFRMVTDENDPAYNIRPEDPGDPDTGYRIVIPGTIDEICDNPEDRLVCRVTPHEIIGLSAPEAVNGQDLTNFQWLKGDTLIDCDESISPDCVRNENGSLRGTHITFIPITDGIGTKFNVTARANNISGSRSDLTGQSTEMTRQFQVVDPSVRIYPEGLDCGEEGGTGAVHFKTVGFIDDPTGIDPRRTDYSRSTIEADASANVRLRPCFIPDHVGNLINTAAWSVDGMATYSNPDFPAGNVGTIHSVQFSSSYFQPSQIYSILNEKYGVSVVEMVPRPFGGSIQVEVVDDSVGYLKEGGRLFASLLSRLPGQAVFLVRIAFSLLAMVLLLGAIFAFFPKVRYDN